MRGSSIARTIGKAQLKIVSQLKKVVDQIRPRTIGGKQIIPSFSTKPWLVTPKVSKHTIGNFESISSGKKYIIY